MPRPRSAGTPGGREPGGRAEEELSALDWGARDGSEGEAERLRGPRPVCRPRAEGSELSSGALVPSGLSDGPTG